MDKQILEANIACRLCGEVKSSSEFHRSPSNRSGLDSRCKTCKRAINQQRYIEKKEEIDARNRAWQANNKEKVREIQRRHYHRHQQKRTAYSREYYRLNRERLQAYARQYAKENPEIYRKAAREYQARLRNAEGSGATLAELIEAHGEFCYLCAVAPATAVDHVTPLSRGGTNFPENMRPVCTSCNSHKKDKTLEEYLEVYCGS